MILTFFLFKLLIQIENLIYFIKNKKIVSNLLKKKKKFKIKYK